MGHITRWQGTQAIEQRVQYVLTRTLDRIDVVATLAAYALPKLGRLTWLYGHILVTGFALTKADMEALTAEQLSQHKLAAYYHRREAFKHDLLDLLDQFNQAMHRLIEG